VLLGLVLMPGKATAMAGGGRLGGVIWPIQPSTVSHYAAVLAGTTIILWLAGLVAARAAAVVSVASVAVLLLTHTRTGLIGLLIGVLVGGLSLFLSRQRVRKALAVVTIVGALVAVSFAPFLGAWFTRGESSHDLSTLTGRTEVWSELIAQPRSEVNTVFGYGMSNDSFKGLPIDSSWYATYLDQGLFGDVVDGSVLLVLLLIALLSTRGPRRAVALFLVVFCFISSFVETGLGEASPYLLDLAVAMAVLAVPATATVGELPAA
ncbi:MAG TPA: O-antigen ligase family protein, partial [Acidimicrobiales bacterium]|nr:O-antigen ligase family protein [Acidimicrobiales bacterium]